MGDGKDSVITNLSSALRGLMQAVNDMPAAAEECWPEEWAAAESALSDADSLLSNERS